MDARVSPVVGLRSGWQKVSSSLYRALLSIAQPIAAFLGLIILWQAVIMILSVPIHRE